MKIIYSVLIATLFLVACASGVEQTAQQGSQQEEEPTTIVLTNRLI